VITILQGEVFINGARFVEADIDAASNGILHIIDNIFLEPTYTSNANSYITAQYGFHVIYNKFHELTILIFNLFYVTIGRCLLLFTSDCFYVVQ